MLWCDGSGVDLPELGAEPPMDAEGFVLAVHHSDTEGIRDFFERWGFVLVREVLSAAECEATLVEFRQTTAAAAPSLVEAGTWASFFDNPGLNRFQFAGIVGNSNDFSPTLLGNRQSAQVHQAFSAVLGRSELFVDHDRLGVMRPTVGVDLGDGEGARDRPEWRTKNRWLHLDCNPTSAKEGITRGYVSQASMRAKPRAIVDFSRTIMTQGLITLTDAAVSDGGFHCVPASHRASISLLLEAKLRSKTQLHCSQRGVQVDDQSELQQLVRPIPIRRGCVCIWSSLLLHGNHPNQSTRFRAVQYIRMVPLASCHSAARSCTKAYT